MTDTWRQSDEAIRSLIAAEIWAFQEYDKSAFGDFAAVDDDAFGAAALAKRLCIDEAERIRRVILESPVVRARILGAVSEGKEPHEKER